MEEAGLPTAPNPGRNTNPGRSTATARPQEPIYAVPGDTYIRMRSRDRSADRAPGYRPGCTPNPSR